MTEKQQKRFNQSWSQSQVFWKVFCFHWCSEANMWTIQSEKVGCTSASMWRQVGNCSCSNCYGSCAHLSVTYLLSMLPKILCLPFLCTMHSTIMISITCAHHCLHNWCAHHCLDNWWLREVRLQVRQLHCGPPWFQFKMLQSLRHPFLMEAWSLCMIKTSIQSVHARVTLSVFSTKLQCQPSCSCSYQASVFKNR